MGGRSSFFALRDLSHTQPAPPYELPTNGLPATQPLQTRPILGLDTRGHMQGKAPGRKTHGAADAGPDPLPHYGDVIEQLRRRQRAQDDDAQGGERRRLAHFVQFFRHAVSCRPDENGIASRRQKIVPL